MQKAIKWDENTAKLVRLLASLGITQASIAEQVKISLAVIKKVYRKELTEGKNYVHDLIHKTIVQLALKGDRTLLIFYAKTQMGWKETQKLEHEGALELPTPIFTNVKPK